MKPDALHTAALQLGATARPGADPEATFTALRPAAIDHALTDPTFRALGPAGWTTAYERLIAHHPTLTPTGLHLTPSRDARKRHGGWYTPAPIVEALLDHALPWLTATDPSAIPSAIPSALPSALSSAIPSTLPAALSSAIPSTIPAATDPFAAHLYPHPLTLRICDPACGAGPFLLAAAHRLTAALLRYDPTLDPTHARRRIVARCLYGTDLDPGAITLTRHILEDYAGTPIPSLTHHLRTGDALLGPAPGLPLPPNLPPFPSSVIDWPTLTPAPGFHATIGNPPYRAGRLAALAPHATRLRATCPTAEYQLDPYLLFLDRAARITRPGGRLSLLVPRTWMSNHRAARLRSWLLTTHQLESLVEVPAEAFDAIVTTTIATFRIDCGPSPATLPVTTLSVSPTQHTQHTQHPQHTQPTRHTQHTQQTPSQHTPSQPTQHPQPTLTIHLTGAPLPLARDPQATALLARSARWTTTLGDIADITRGINPYHHTTHTPDQIRARIHHADTPRPHYAPELRGRDLPAAYHLRPPSRHIHYGPWLKEPRHPRYFDGPRLLVRKILAHTLCAAAIDHPLYCDQSIYIAHLHPHQPYPPHALLACVTSHLIATLLRTRHQTHDRHFPQLKVTDLRALPLPPTPPDDPRWQTLAQAAATLQAINGRDATLRATIEAIVTDLYQLALPPPDP